MSIEELRLKNQGLVEAQQSSGAKPNNVSTEEADTSGYIIDGSSTSTASQTESTELVSEDDAVVGGELDINPFSMVDDSAIKAEYMSLDTDNNGVLTKEELLSWDGIIDGISGTLDNLKSVFAGLGLKVDDASGSTSAPSADGEGNVSTDVPVENTQPAESGEEIMPDAVKIDDLKDATKDEFKEVAKQSEELWKEIENIGMNDVFKLIDTDEDGKVSEEELQAIAELDSENNEDGKDSISIEDLKKAVENDKAAKAEEAKAEETAKAKEESNKSDTQVQKQNLRPSNGVSGGGGVGGSSGAGGGSYGGGTSGVSGASTSDLPKAETLEELQQQKTQLETEITDKQSEMSEISAGTSDKVSAEKQAMEDAKEDMEEAIKNDDKINKETKDEYLELTNNIEKNNQAISENESETMQTESSISQTESSISTLESSLNSLTLSGEEDDEQKAKIEARRSELESQISDKKAELEDLKAKKEELESEKTDLEKEKADLDKQKAELEKEVLKNASPETKAAIKTYNDKQEAFESKKTEALSTAKSELDTKVKELSEVEQKINEKQDQEAKGPTFDFEEGEYSEAEMAAFEANWAENKERYEAVAEKTGVPAELIAAIHWREGSGNFDTYLHNGDPLGSPTTHVPAGIYFDNWEEAAIDAISSHRGDSTLTADSTDLDAMADFAERYNGLGYRNRGVPSAYVWAGTDQYTSGKFVADGQYDPNAVDQQLGVMLMLKHIM